MGIFGKIFEKKECSVCGKEIGLLGNRKLEDGNCCKECARKLSPWFDDRRHSTVDQIKRQIIYRDENRMALNGFRPTVSYGEYYPLRAELTNGVPTRFVVERTDNYMEENADIISFRDVTSFNIDVRASSRELMDKNSEGKEIRFIPPRFEYSYEFYAEIHVNNPYFDDMCFPIFRDSVDLETNLLRAGFDPTIYPEYRQRRLQCTEMEDLFQAGIRGLPLNGFAPAVQFVVQAAPTAQSAYQPVQTAYGQSAYQPAQAAYGQQAYQPAQTPEPQPASTGPKFCPNCGAPNTGAKFCQNCGSRL